MPCFWWNLWCGPTNTTIEINQLRSNLTNYNNNIITIFTKKLTYQYKLMKFKQKLFRTLRFLQFLGGFGITTMTTYNNPYFQDKAHEGPLKSKHDIVRRFYSLSGLFLLGAFTIICFSEEFSRASIISGKEIFGVVKYFLY